MSDTFMSGQVPQTSGATGPAGGDLSGTYPNPAISTGKMQAGSITLGSLAAGGGSVTTTVTYPTAFSLAPRSVVAVASGILNLNVVATVGNITATTFSLTVTNWGSTATTAGAQWFAFE